MKQAGRVLVFLGMGVALLSDPVHAAKDNRDKELLRRLQQQVQQLDQVRAMAEEEKAAAHACKLSLDREVEKAKAASRKLAAAQVARVKAERDLKTAQAELDILKSRLADTDAKLANLRSEFEATARTLTQTEMTKKRTETQLAGTTQDLGRCRAQNGKLYSLSREMMAKYRDKTCQDALTQAEPFTGLKRVEVENLLETWRDRADDARLIAEERGASHPR